jgi:hypothetical protein
MVISDITAADGKLTGSIKVLIAKLRRPIRHPGRDSAPDFRVFLGAGR